MNIKVLYQFMREKHPRTYKHWINDLYEEKYKTLTTSDGFTETKQSILIEYEKNLPHCSNIDKLKTAREIDMSERLLK